jgi:hypothetical protein
MLKRKADGDGSIVSKRWRVFPYRITQEQDLLMYLPADVDGRVLLRNYLVLVVERAESQLYTIKHAIGETRGNVLVLVDNGACKWNPGARRSPRLLYVVSCVCVRDDTNPVTVGGL